MAEDATKNRRWWRWGCALGAVVAATAGLGKVAVQRDSEPPIDAAAALTAMQSAVADAGSFRYTLSIETSIGSGPDATSRHSIGDGEWSAEAFRSVVDDVAGGRRRHHRRAAPGSRGDRRGRSRRPAPAPCGSGSPARSTPPASRSASRRGTLPSRPGLFTGVQVQFDEVIVEVQGDLADDERDAVIGSLTPVAPEIFVAEGFGITQR